MFASLRETTSSYTVTKEKSSMCNEKMIRNLAPFLSKTYNLLESSHATRIVSWNEEGTGFVVWLPDEFSQHILPLYFKHSNFSSFIRQLNTYGFKKSSSDRWEFRHDKFQRGRLHLLTEISRRKCEASVFPSFIDARESSSSNSDDAGRSSLIKQNQELRKENEELRSQINQYKELGRKMRKVADAVCIESIDSGMDHAA